VGLSTTYDQKQNFQIKTHPPATDRPINTSNYQKSIDIPASGDKTRLPTPLILLSRRLLMVGVGGFLFLIG
jgi:hypothetical protein